MLTIDTDYKGIVFLCVQAGLGGCDNHCCLFLLSILPILREHTAERHQNIRTKDMAYCCVFAAAKIEEPPIMTKVLLAAAHHVKHYRREDYKKLDVDSKVYWNIG